MQVTPEMIRAAREAMPTAVISDVGIAAVISAALDAMPKATGGLIPGSDRLIPQPADVTPPQKVHDAADNLPGLTFNLNQQYGGLDEAAAKKLRLNVDPGDGHPQAADG